MENIIEEKPTDDIHGRSLFNTIFVSDEDIKDKNILDIGCGFGWFELNAKNRGAKKIVGLEITENDLKTAKKYIRDNSVEFKAGSATKLPFPKKSFDTVVAWEVIEHIPKNTESLMFQEIKRVLKSGGTFYLSTPFDSFLSKFFDPAWWLIGHRHYSEKKLYDLAKNNGLVVEEVVLNGGFWEIIGINNLYISKWIFRRRPFFDNFINSRQNKEYKKRKGFTNIFIKLKNS